MTTEIQNLEMRSVQNLSGEETPSRFSQELEGLADLADGKDVPFIQIFRHVRGRGLPAMIVILSLVMMLIPGASVLLGGVIMLFGWRMIFGKHPMIPRRLLRARISRVHLERMVKRAVPAIRWVEMGLKPRWLPLCRSTVAKRFNGNIVLFCGLALVLPLPIPFTNMIPATGLILLAVGLMEEDGVFVAMGYLGALSAWLYLASLIWAGKVGWETLLHWMHHASSG